MTAPALEVRWSDESVAVDPSRPFTIGRSADLVLDDNPHLHRRLLQLHADHGMWWLTNIGGGTAVTVGTEEGHFQAHLGPGATLPVVFPLLRLVLTAGAHTYDLVLACEGAVMAPSRPAPATGDDVTRQPLRLSDSQRLLVTALAEPALRRPGGGLAAIPSSADVAARLGWPLTTFNRKLDAVCEKLDRAGVEGLRGGPGQLASNRRARLVEYALVAHLVTPRDLDDLDALATVAEGAAGARGAADAPADPGADMSDDTQTGR